MDRDVMSEARHDRWLAQVAFDLLSDRPWWARSVRVAVTEVTRVTWQGGAIRPHSVYPALERERQVG